VSRRSTRAAGGHDGDTPGALLRCADTALYRAKADGRGRVCLFAPEMEPAARRGCSTRPGGARAQNGATATANARSTSHSPASTAAAAEPRGRIPRA
jgi:hypothetical protein